MNTLITLILTKEFQIHALCYEKHWLIGEDPQNVMKLKCLVRSTHRNKTWKYLTENVQVAIFCSSMSYKLTQLMKLTFKK